MFGIDDLLQPDTISTGMNANVADQNLQHTIFRKILFSASSFSQSYVFWVPNSIVRVRRARDVCERPTVGSAGRPPLSIT